MGWAKDRNSVETACARALWLERERHIEGQCVHSAESMSECDERQEWEVQQGPEPWRVTEGGGAKAGAPRTGLCLLKTILAADNVGAQPEQATHLQTSAFFSGK